MTHECVCGTTQSDRQGEEEHVMCVCVT